MKIIEILILLLLLIIFLNIFRGNSREYLTARNGKNNNQDNGDWVPGGDMTHYWDCCKESCAWNDSPYIVNSCNASGLDPSLTRESGTSICNGGDITTCRDRYPWIGEKDGNQVLYGYVAGPNNGKEPCGSCYELQLDNAKNGIKTAYVQQTSLGNVNGIFDFAVPGGGFGDFNGCEKMNWNVYTDQGGPCDPTGDNDQCARYGGLTNKSLCDTVFSKDTGALNACKKILFDLFPLNSGGINYPGNLKISQYRSIPCPDELTKNTGVSAPPWKPPPPPSKGQYCNEDCGDCSWVGAGGVNCSDSSKCGSDKCYTTCCAKYNCKDWCTKS